MLALKQKQSALLELERWEALQHIMLPTKLEKPCLTKRKLEFLFLVSMQMHGNTKAMQLTVAVNEQCIVHGQN